MCEHRQFGELHERLRLARSQSRTASSRDNDDADGGNRGGLA